MNSLSTLILSRLQDNEDGATAVEYGLLVALIAAVIVVMVATVGGQVSAGFQNFTDLFTANS
jgi:pilus assembly protein Flp/PilA